MARSAASYILMLDEQSSQAQNVLHTPTGVLHKSLTMKHCFRLHFITPRHAPEMQKRRQDNSSRPTKEKLSFYIKHFFLVFCSLRLFRYSHG
jgi:hypothetical protein